MANKAIAVPTSVAAGAATKVFGPFTAWLSGAFSATYQLQISPDNVSFYNEGSALTAAGNVQVVKQCSWVRWNATAWTSGAPTSVALSANLDTL